MPSKCINISSDSDGINPGSVNDFSASSDEQQNLQDNVKSDCITPGSVKDFSASSDRLQKLQDINKSNGITLSIFLSLMLLCIHVSVNIR